MSMGGALARSVRTFAAVAALMVVATSAHQSFSGVRVTVNGVGVSAAEGGPVADVPEVRALAAWGKVYSAAGHVVIDERTGLPPTVLVNGKIAPPSRSVHRDDRIRVIPGADIVEPVVQTTATIEPESRSVGVGPQPKVIAPGAPGYAVLRVGAYSGEVVATETVVPAAPGLVRNVPAEGTPLVALTFDDGPWPGQTMAILDVLAQRNVPATFFMLGSRVERAPDVARAVVGAGHVVGNHTYGHVYLDAVSPGVAAWEIEHTNNIIQSVTGVRPGWLRAPGGRLRGEAHARIAAAGMRSALWTVDPQDWREELPPDALAAKVVAAVRPGAVVVLHDGGGNQAATIAALPAIIDTLRAQGYEFVTLDEMPGVREGW